MAIRRSWSVNIVLVEEQGSQQVADFEGRTVLSGPSCDTISAKSTCDLDGLLSWRIDRHRHALLANSLSGNQSRFPYRA